MIKTIGLAAEGRVPSGWDGIWVEHHQICHSIIHNISEPYLSQEPNSHSSNSYCTAGTCWFNYSFISTCIIYKLHYFLFIHLFLASFSPFLVLSLFCIFGFQTLKEKKPDLNRMWHRITHNVELEYSLISKELCSQEYKNSNKMYG